MAWLEITLDTVSEKIESVAAQLTAQGFAELVIEDQAEFESFLDENRAYWDYIDEDLQQKLQGLSISKFIWKIPTPLLFPVWRPLPLPKSRQRKSCFTQSSINSMTICVEAWAPVPKVRPGSRITGVRSPVSSAAQ